MASRIDEALAAAHDAVESDHFSALEACRALLHMLDELLALAHGDGALAEPPDHDGQS